MSLYLLIKIPFKRTFKLNSIITERRNNKSTNKVNKKSGTGSLK